MGEEHTAMDAGTALNRALWDVRATRHGSTEADRFYDVDSFLTGRQTLYALERELVGDVAGKDLLHLHCHFGMDTVNWARLGARATGVDFSPVAVERARELAGRAGVDAAFVEADTQRLPASLAGRFDVVVATYGVLCWIGDLAAWMGGAAAALRPGGSLVLVDLHPAYQTVGRLDPLLVDWPYGGGAPHRETVTGTYADADLEMPAQETVQYPYSLGEIVTAAANAGLVVRHLAEHTDAEFDPRGLLPEGGDGRYRLPFGDSYLPVLYSLRAEAPSGTR
ncbi:class I SAM-dependent methyltransferase [Yinghuangia seranimata]|uniref:class I SAM-dependent methyltransferase n=1 Tax=Yinghuangia seranimata TaxID=408067 RepID=UPI00248B2772|nr:class I SAM-dependent methyltransferase [Yinghuangia seranimata]MDI2126932.1 class I SAM-dependent methyltransferase [Yinghuangia seranimata]